MDGHECYHCKQWIAKGEAHDCWTTTEAALTKDLSEELRDAWDRLRETAMSFGHQRVYASHSSIMFSRKACYFFVRPKKNYLEVVIFLGRIVKAPQIRNVVESSKVKRAHVLRVIHRDEVEPPMTDWLREAYETSEALSAKSATERKRPSRSAARGKRRKGYSSPSSSR
jgi:hypothetical protein